LAWSPDGKRVASGHDGGLVRLWDVATGQVVLTLLGHSKAVKIVAWAPDGMRLASASYDGTIPIWDGSFPLPCPFPPLRLPPHPPQFSHLPPHTSCPTHPGRAANVPPPSNDSLEATRPEDEVQQCLMRSLRPPPRPTPSPPSRPRQPRPRPRPPRRRSRRCWS